MSYTKSLSPLSHRAELCCHATAQALSIILRSIKRCGYPGRCESCLSFHSHSFVFISLYASPSSPPKFFSHSSLVSPLSLLPFISLFFYFYLRSPRFFFLLHKVPAAVVMKALNIRGNPWTARVASSHLSFCAKALVL